MTSPSPRQSAPAHRRNAPVPTLSSPARAALTAAGATFLALLTGCAGMQTALPSPAASAVALGGSVKGGQQPVTGARVYLYAAGNTGYGSASIPLLGTGTTTSGLAVDGNGNSYTTTDNNGQFTITGNYSCAAASANGQVYLLALGGNPGLASGTSNSAIALLAGLGSCNNLTAGSNYVINEVTTAGTVTAVQQFMTDATHIGTSPTNTSGLQNAFLALTNLVDVASGSSRSTPVSGSGFSPQLKTNTLGDILAPCVNSAGPTSTACGNLFAAATPGGGSAPADVAAAMLLIAKKPGNNIAPLFQQIDANAPFQPVLSAAPHDYTLPVTFTGGGLLAPGTVVIDAAGNAWTANCPTCNGIAGTDSLVGFNPVGTVLSGASGFTSSIHHPAGIAWDTLGNLWSDNIASGSTPDQVVKMNSSGTVAPGFPFTSSNLAAPLGIALDSASNAWVTNSSITSSTPLNSVLAISQAGTQVGTPYTMAGFTTPFGIGIDPANDVFAAGTTSANILKITAASVKTLLSGNGLTSPVGISIDHSNNLWTINNTNTLSVLSGTTGAVVTANVGVGTNQAVVVAIDGAGTGWSANCRGGCPGSGSLSPDDLLHFDINGNSLVPGSDGLQDSHLSAAGSAAIDQSGNVWVSNNSGGSLTQFVGIAAPVATPLARASATNQLGVRP